MKQPTLFIQLSAKAIIIFTAVASLLFVCGILPPDWELNAIGFVYIAGTVLFARSIVLNYTSRMDITIPLWITGFITVSSPLIFILNVAIYVIFKNDLHKLTFWISTDWYNIQSIIGFVVVPMVVWFIIRVWLAL